MAQASIPYLATLPGYPREYFEKHLKIAQPDPAERTGEPGYDYMQVEPITQQETGNNFTPIDPVNMYASCFSWISYPYGIPDDAQPCPYAKEAAPTFFRSLSPMKTSSMSSASLESDPADLIPHAASELTAQRSALVREEELEYGEKLNAVEQEVVQHDLDVAPLAHEEQEKEFMSYRG